MPQPPVFTILAPINRPPDLLPFAIQSVLGQSRQDFELFIICDGAPPATVEAARRFEAEDRRIRAFVHPKGERYGEAYRHLALQEARGRIVCQIGDDDLWFPDHLAQVDALMASADFGNTLPLFLGPDGTPSLLFADLADPAVQRRMSSGVANFFGPTVSAYRLETYRALPLGWSPAPEGTFTDLWMWRKFLALPNLRCATRLTATALQFPQTMRRDWTLPRRREEISAYAEAIGRPEERDRLWRAALGDVAHGLIQLRQQAQGMMAAGQRMLQGLADADDALSQIVEAKGDTQAQTILAQEALARLPDRAWRARLLGAPT